MPHRGKQLSDLSDGGVRARAENAAHNAYHEHNNECECRTVGHLTEYIANAVLDSLAGSRRDACATCAGTGAQLCECDRGERSILNCWSCSGRDCEACDGSGLASDEERRG